MAHSEPEHDLDPKLRAWLIEEIERRVLPMHWRPLLQQLVSWAGDYRDGLALHDLLKQYPRRDGKALHDLLNPYPRTEKTK